MSKAWELLVPKMKALADLKSALMLLHWDQLVMMPSGGGEARGRILATLRGIAHDRLGDPELGDLLAQLAEDASLDADERASVRVLRRDHERAARVPNDLVRAIAEQSTITYGRWTEARRASDFAQLEAELGKLVDLKKAEADALGWERERYEALLDEYEPGMTAAELENMFGDLVSGLQPIVDTATEGAGPRPAFLVGDYDPAKQDMLCRRLVTMIGFDFAAGRFDTAPHPFTAGVAPGDVRQTTRYRRDEPFPALYAAMHETGHALYEQGLPEAFNHLPIRRAPSGGVHESQSRLWENHVGRSRGFVDYLFPHLKELFSAELDAVTSEDLYRAVCHPRRSLCRVEADELTYNLHIVLRFELELAMFRDELATADLPDAWDAAMEKYVGVRPLDHSDGVLQDMHWCIGMFGYFPTYSLGDIYAAALWETVEQQLGSLDTELRVGDTSRLLEWLRENIHQQGYRYEAKELIERVTGKPPSPHPLLRYLRSKYSDLFGFGAGT